MIKITNEYPADFLFCLKVQFSKWRRLDTGNGYKTNVVLIEFVIFINCFPFLIFFQSFWLYSVNILFFEILLFSLFDFLHLFTNSIQIHLLIQYSDFSYISFNFRFHVFFLVVGLLQFKSKYLIMIAASAKWKIRNSIHATILTRFGDMKAVTYLSKYLWHWSLLQNFDFDIQFLICTKERSWNSWIEHSDLVDFWLKNWKDETITNPNKTESLCFIFPFDYFFESSTYILLSLNRFFDFQFHKDLSILFWN